MDNAPLLFQLPDDDTLYRALLERDPAYDGFAFVGVKSTGVFCRLTCAARKPKRENTVFFSSIKACVEAGFRACLRCRPLEQTGAQEPLVKQLLALLENNADKRWYEGDLIELGFDPSTVRRAFKRHFGVTFLEMARLRRIGEGMQQLAGGASVIDAQIEANKLVQYAHLSEWTLQGQAPDAPRPDLVGQIRPQLDLLQKRLLQQLADFSPYRNDPQCPQ
ncbi:Ada metal-binding domain-containing protein, partial [Pseudomonas chlororaphis]|uniref:Ada metal-binding domain-containing protein n=1 Tax=Pseudomonas chlororaphis TaxID=587753 RepID=UPI0024A755AF